LGNGMRFDWLLPIMSADQSNDSWVTEQFIGEIQLADNIRGTLRAHRNGSAASDSNSNDEAARISFDRTQQPPRLQGNLQFADESDLASIDVESVWLQSILNAVEQRERFVVRFKTRANSISIKFPSVRVGESKFLVNGRKALAVPNPNDGSRFDIPLIQSLKKPEEPKESVYVLEVFTWPLNKPQWIKSLDAAPPSILNSSSHSPLIWQILVPATEHLIGRSSSLAPGYRWQWNDLWLGRKSDWTQAQIEQHMGATMQPLVSQQTNQYVLISLDHHTQMKVWMAPRYLIWGPVALCVLLCTLFVTESRWIARPWLAVSLLLVGVAFSQWAWDLTIAISQCFVVAMGIAILYASLKWMVDRRSRRRSVFSSRPAAAIIQAANRSASPSGSSRAITAALPESINPAPINPPLLPSTNVDHEGLGGGQG
jgi:hypothetical protein